MKQTRASRTPAPRKGISKAEGQALIIVALAMTLLILFIGLGVDAAQLMAKRSKLQSAVDSAALSAAQILYNGTDAAALTKGYQMIEANGVPSNTLDLTTTGATVVEIPGQNQVRVKATQHVSTFFMRLIPAFSTVDISAEATADATSYAEIPIKPYGTEGIVNELNLSVWGSESRRHNGDAYSPLYAAPDHSSTLPVNTTAYNPYYDKQPYGYLYRIDVPADYAYSSVVVQIFDADSYNRTGTPTPTVTPSGLTPTPTPTMTVDQYAYCSSYTTTCTTGGNREDTGLKLNAFPNGLPAFWRVDENRPHYYESNTVSWNDNRMTTTRYTLWHFSPHNTTAFGDPTTLSDYPSGSSTKTYVAQWTAPNDTSTDLRWYQPPGFNITLNNFEAESNGKYYFYLYVQGISGSSENNFDLRAGPPSNTPDCSVAASNYTSPCYINYLYKNNLQNWNTGGATIFAKRSLPLNLDTGTGFPVRLAQISRNAAGQVLGVRHFDQDCNGGCPNTMNYQMQKCGTTGANASDWASVGTGYIGGNDFWVAASGTTLLIDPSTGTTYPDPEKVTIPDETSQFFQSGATSCDTSWLRIELYPSYAQDTSVWELPFLRPRLIK